VPAREGAVEEKRKRFEKALEVVDLRPDADRGRPGVARTA
jgi:hypothetical protein